MEHHEYLIFYLLGLLLSMADWGWLTFCLGFQAVELSCL